jgi:hypothetical protein
VYHGAFSQLAVALEAVDVGSGNIRGEAEEGHEAAGKQDDSAGSGSHENAPYSGGMGAGEQLIVKKDITQQQ